MSAPQTTTPRRFVPDAVAAVLLGLLGLYVLATSADWTILDADGPGPGFFPLIYGLGIIAGALVLLIGALQQRPRDEAPRFDRAGLLRAVSLWMVFAGSIFVMRFAGFGLALALLILFFSQAVFRRSVWFTAVACVMTPIGFHLVFTRLLGVELPVGVWTGF